MVSGKLSAADVHLPCITVTTSFFFFSLLAPLGHSLPSLPLWLSLTGCLGTSCSSQLASPPCDKLARLVLLLSLNLISVYHLCEKGLKQLCSCKTRNINGMLWLMVTFCVASNNSATYSIVNAICHATHCLQRHNSGRMTSFLPSHDG